MRNLVYLIATTIDGFIAENSEGDPDFFLFEGPQSADLLEEFPEMIPGHVRPLIKMPGDTPNARFDTVLMGRATYNLGRAVGVTSPYPHLRQIIVSSSIETLPDPSVEIVADNVIHRVRELKAESGQDIWLCGGGHLAATLIDEIDEFIFKVSPVILGNGISLFGDVIGPRQLTMTSHRIYDNGFALLRYRPTVD